LSIWFSFLKIAISAAPRRGRDIQRCHYIAGVKFLQYLNAQNFIFLSAPRPFILPPAAVFLLSFPQIPLFVCIGALFIPRFFTALNRFMQGVPA